MYRHEILGVIVRLFAIVLALFALRFIPSTLFLSKEEFGFNFVVSASVVLSIFIVSFLLWKFPITIAKAIYPNVVPDTKTDSLSQSELFSFGLIMLGVYLLYVAISDSAFWLIYIITSNFGKETYPTLSTEDVANIYSTIVELLLSFWLIFGSRGLSKLIKHLRGR